MSNMHPITPIIRTSAYSMLSDTAQTLLAKAQLSIVRGHPGIGKSFALQQIETELSRGGDEIYLMEAPSDKSRSLDKFFRKALFDLGFYGHGGADPYEYFKGVMLRSFPFRTAGYRPRVLLIVDECQRLAPNILEALRGAFDGGRIARDEDLMCRTSEAPAFGILLVGNHHFLTRGGRDIAATFDALTSRGPIINLARPEQGEYLKLAASLFPESDQLQTATARFGAKRGQLRSMANVAARAHHYAGSQTVSLIHLEKAILFEGGDQ
jgi:AAA domain